MNQLLINLLTGIVLPNLISEKDIIAEDRSLYFKYTYRHVETGLECIIIVDEAHAMCADEIHKGYLQEA